MNNNKNAEALGFYDALEERDVPKPQYNPGIDLTHKERKEYIDGYNYGRRWCMFNKNKIGKRRYNKEFDNSVPGKITLN